MVIQNSWNNTLRTGVKVNFGSDAQGDTYYLSNTSVLTRLAVGTSGQALVSNGTIPSWGNPNPGGTASGDLSGSYPAPTIAANTVTFAKMQNIGTGNLLGRATAGTGAIELLGASTARTLLGLGTAALTNTGVASGNVPILDGSGKLDTSVLPNLAISSVQVVADQTARLALSNVDIGDVAKQTDNGIAYILSALPASTNSNWVSLGDTSLTLADIPDSALGTGTANNTTFLRGDRTWGTVSSGGFTYNTVAGTSQSMAVNNGYICNNASLVTLTLPSVANVGDICRILSYGAGGYRIAQNSGQKIYNISQSTTTGTGGRIDFIDAIACVELICLATNSDWMVSGGNYGTMDLI